jgi:hypothetical protein
VEDLVLADSGHYSEAAAELGVWVLYWEVLVDLALYLVVFSGGLVGLVGRSPAARKLIFCSGRKKSCSFIAL